MPKKIYDIKPPKTVKKIEEPKPQPKPKPKPEPKPEMPEQILVNNNIPNYVADKMPEEEKSWPVWATVLISISVVLVLAGVYLFFKLPKADIVIWPKVDTLSFQQTITADKSDAEPDLAGAVVPAKYFEAAKTNSQDFPATGNASDEGKASGNILIYNKYDPPASLTLKAGTHFMSDSGKLFVTFQKVVIPAATKSGSKLTPGSVQIQVQAVEGGTDYNIAPANFSVPGLQGTAYYYSIYAVSSAAMAGGYTGKIKKVTDSDIQQAKDTLSASTVADAISALKAQLPSDYVLLDDAIVSNVTDAASQTKSGTVAENFTYHATATAGALAFKKSDLEDFARKYIVSQIPDGKTLLDNSFKVDYSASKVDFSAGQITLNIDFSAGVYQAIDKNSLSLSLLGKNPSQVQEAVSRSLGDQVSKVQTTLWPFWVTSVPNSQKAVTLELKFQ